VEDNLDPVAVAQDITVQLDANGQATITSDDIENASTDNCGISSTSLDITSFDCDDIGANTVTLTVTDTSGNTASATATVFVEETENPVAIGQDITVQLDETGNVSVSGSNVNNGSTDNCGITNLYLDVSAFDCSDIGDNTVLFTVQDGSGNTDSVNVTVTVEDNIGPTVIGQDITIDLAGNPSVSITPQDLDNGSFDNCSNVSLSIDVDTFTSIGDYQVVLTVTDDEGNASSQTFTVTVIDTLRIDENEIEKLNLKIYPNPVHKELFVETNINIEEYIIVDLYGKILKNSKNMETSIFVNDLADGVYFIRFTSTSSQLIVKKFIKKSFD
jgi:hypothetical protein